MTKTFTADEILTAADVNTYLVNRMYKRTPTSVSGSGVAISATGDITLTNATTVTVNGVFSSDFRVYDIFYDSVGTAATSAMQLRASGVTNTTGYDVTELLGRNATASSSTVLNSADFTILGAAQTRHAVHMRLYAPAVAVETALTANVGQHANPAVSSTANLTRAIFGTHRTAAAYDGFVLTFSAAQSGQLTVMGLY